MEEAETEWDARLYEMKVGCTILDEDIVTYDNLSGKEKSV